MATPLRAFSRAARHARCTICLCALGAGDNSALSLFLSLAPKFELRSLHYNGRRCRWSQWTSELSSSSIWLGWRRNLVWHPDGSCTREFNDRGSATSQLDRATFFLLLLFHLLFVLLLLEEIGPRGSLFLFLFVVLDFQSKFGLTKCN